MNETLMGGEMIPFGFLLFLAIVFLPIIVVIAMYNGLVKLRNQCDESWSDVDTELRRRYDLIPNLVNTVKGYAQHERELLEEVTRLRQVCVDDHGTPAHQAETENQLVRSLNTLMARVENYPDLKASRNFLELQNELTNTEDRIQAARRFYNANVRDNNNHIQMFPSNLIAGMFNFSLREYFNIEDTRAREAPVTNFDRDKC